MEFQDKIVSVTVTGRKKNFLSTIAEDRLAPSGYIRVRGELWRAELMGNGPPIDRGQRVRVREISELKLIVQADDAGNDQTGS